jgi:hypothetical protein
MVGYILGMYIAETKEAVVLCSDSSFFMISKHLIILCVSVFLIDQG